MEAKTVAAQLTSMRMLTPSTVELQLTPASSFAFEAGQYVELSFPEPDAAAEPRFWPMALASAPQDAQLTFCIRQRDGSALLPYLEALDPALQPEILVRGPFGSFGYRSAGPRQIGLIVTGTGIAPIRSLVRSASFQQHSPKTTVLFGAMTPDELPYAGELQALENVTLIPVLSHADETWDGTRGWVTDVLDAPDAPFDWSQTDFYLCGQPAMQEAATAILLKHGVPESAIFTA